MPSLAQRKKLRLANRMVVTGSAKWPSRARGILGTGLTNESSKQVGTMPTIPFKSYRGTAWEYDIVSRKIAPANGEIPRRPHQAVMRRFFREMRGVSREEFDDQIENHAEILILNVTDRCNMRCKYCAFSGAYHGQRVHGVDSMSLDTALLAIDQFIARAGSTLRNSEKKLAITFYGGEPLLAFAFIKEILHQVHEVKYSALSSRITHSITVLNQLEMEILGRSG